MIVATGPLNLEAGADGRGVPRPPLFGKAQEGIVAGCGSDEVARARAGLECGML